MSAPRGLVLAVFLFFFTSFSVAFSSHSLGCRRGGVARLERYISKAGLGSGRVVSAREHLSSRPLEDGLKLQFKKRAEGGNSDEGFFSKLKSYIPGLRRSTATMPEPETELGYRFQIRLTKKGNTRDKRHIITRIMRFLPDIQWETACEIVDNAWQNDASVVRYLNSKKEAQELQAVLGRADPPVCVEVFDIKKGEIVI